MRLGTKIHLPTGGGSYVIPTPAGGCEESQVPAKATHETPHYVRSDMAAYFRRPWC
jgi:hypothetical protein